MAKTKHNNFLDTIDEIITDAKKNGIVQLYSEDEFFTGRKIKVKGKELFHFGTTGYLGLEQDFRLKEAAIGAILKYGTQFPLSKTYISHPIYKELEEKLYEMYKLPILVSKNSTLADIAVIPTIVRDEDAVILDHQVHWSIQNACQLLKPRGISVEVIRHNNMNMLEDKIKEYGNKFKKIWYMCDGVYSMFGDYTPLDELIILLNKFPHLNLYIDDVHGMSWAGKNGTGWVLSKLGNLHERIILLGTLSKSFGASGAVTVFPNEEILRKVKTFGGPLTFSAQLEPSSVASAIASANIHLSNEIYEMQTQLMDLVSYCNSLIKETNLPLVEDNHCPVFFIGTGIPAAGYNFVDRMIKEGYYVNLGVFPAVPIKNTGVRFTISRHNKKEDIKGLVQAMEYHHDLALKDVGKSNNHVRRSFNLPIIKENEALKENEAKSLLVEHYTSISQIDKNEWNFLLGANGIFDWEGLEILEKGFSENLKQEENWEFHYYIIKHNRIPILATFFTISLMKDDMLAPASVSSQIEEKRKDKPYYMTSKVLSMGSIFSEGQHFYLDKSDSKWREAISLLLKEIETLQENKDCKTTILRDFEDNDKELKEIFLNNGFFKIDLPESCIIENLNWKDKEEYLSSLSAKSRSHLRSEILKIEPSLEFEIKKTLTEEEKNLFIELYKQVANKNYDINLFTYPQKIFDHILEVNNNWEFIVCRIKPELDLREKKNIPIAISATYLNSSSCYTGVLLGLDYGFLKEFKIYKQLIYQTIIRAKSINAKKVYLGVSASIEKKKFGARVIPKVAFVQTKDNFELDVIGMVQIKK